MIDKLSTPAQQIKSDVLKALQNAEEMGGVRDSAEYIELMLQLQEEIALRVHNATAALHA